MDQRQCLHSSAGPSCDPREGKACLWACLEASPCWTLTHILPFYSCPELKMPPSTPTDTLTSTGCGDWYFVQNGNKKTRDCSWVGGKPDKRCNKNGGYGECVVDKECTNDPLYNTTCGRHLAYVACPDECPPTSKPTSTPTSAPISDVNPLCEILQGLPRKLFFCELNLVFVSY